LWCGTGGTCFVSALSFAEGLAADGDHAGRHTVDVAITAAGRRRLRDNPRSRLVTQATLTGSAGQTATVTRSFTAKS
jgi:hypothetical protein